MWVSSLLHLARTVIYRDEEHDHGLIRQSN
jgi:hypothetical protein